MSKSTLIHINSADCLEKLTKSIKEQIQSIDKAYDEICVACIGTDRSTGDSLGPLVGWKLSEIEGISIRGTLDDPLHAKNIKEFIRTITPNQLVIAVDAALGVEEHVGCIRIESIPLRPGSGVNKQLPEIGDISITGIVNMAGFMEIMILQNTRLSLVMKMADAIARGLKIALKQVEEI